MAVTVAEFLRSVYPLSGNYWFTAVMGEEWYISAINNALHYIYAFKSHRRNRQIRTEAVWATSSPWYFAWTTNYPIVDVMNFWCGKKLECIKTVQKKHSECCPGNPIKCQECMQACDCSCEKLCSPSVVFDKMIVVWPWSTLDHWQYKISWWEIWMGGMFGNYVEWRLPSWYCCDCEQCDQLYFSYVWWFNPITCPMDKLPIPEPYLPALTFLVTAFTISRYITFRANDDTMYLQMADRYLDFLDGLQVNIPTFIRNKN